MGGSAVIIYRGIIYCLIGGKDAGKKYRDEILAWEGDMWVEAGRMKEGRASHAMTIINQEEVSAYCG